MDTLLGADDASVPSQWWGYARVDGTVFLRRYGGMGAVKEAVATDGVTYVRGPFLAFGRGAALAKLNEKIAVAKTKEAQRRFEAMTPTLSYSPD